MGMGDCWGSWSPNHPAQGTNSASIADRGGGRWDESQKGPQDAASCRLPALLTQSILFLVLEDLDLRLKSQRHCCPPHSPGGLIPTSGEGNLPFPRGWMQAETHMGCG